MPRHELGAAERRARMIGWRSGDVLRATALVTSYLIALALAWVARDIVFTAFLGVLFGLAVGAGAERLTRLHIPRGIGAPLVVIAFLGTLYGVGAAIAPTVRTQVRELRTRVPEAVDRIEAWVNARPGVAGLFLGGHEVAAPSTAAAPPSIGGDPDRARDSPHRHSAHATRAHAPRKDHRAVEWHGAVSLPVPVVHHHRRRRAVPDPRARHLRRRRSGDVSRGTDPLSRAVPAIRPARC